MTDVSIIVLGLLRGLIAENDPTAHFGSLFGYRSHERDAQRLGLIKGSDDDCRPTALGLKLYKQLGLEAYSGRAVSWPRELETRAGAILRSA